MTVPVMFAATVAGHSEAVAVEDDSGRLTYAELDARSNAVAVALAEAGIGAEDRVAVCLPRGASVFVALLGILKAGACYVAVDPRYPAARRELMVQGSGARLALVEPGGEDLAPAACPAMPVPAGTAEHPPPGPAAPRSAACVLFTSGSSGRPKATVLTHEGLVAFARNPSLPALAEGDRVGQLSMLSFDAFHFEAWCTLAQGATVVVLPDLPALLAADLRRELRRRRVTAMLVPTMAAVHILRDDRDAFTSLRILHVGGDALPPATCRDLLAGEFRGRLFNLYGPTEATTACTALEITALPGDATSVPIGRPLHGTPVYVLGPDLRPVPDGEPGEVFVGGPGVARGYLGEAALTAERFRPDPFAADGSRMYATGDRARCRPDGLLEFLGRADDQVKIRGFRVEIGEVERAVSRHPAVRDAAVLPVGDGADRILVAFVVARGRLSPPALREHLAAALPHFMVPAGILVVASIDANEHGKRDRAALRRRWEQERQRVARHTAPSTEVETYLARVWGDLLAVETVGTDDDFFALGGNSMLAFRLQQRIRRDRGLTLEFRDVLRNAVLRDLAAAVERHAVEGERV